MRNFLLLFLLLMPVIGSCTDDYDDSAAWKDIDGIYKDLDQLKEKLNSLQLQANALSQIVKGGAITSVTEAANGGYVISYKGSDNVEHSFTIATTDQMVSSPIIGIQEEAGTYYWTTTTKGQTTFLLDTNKQKSQYRVALLKYEWMRMDIGLSMASKFSTVTKSRLRPKVKRLH